MRGGAGEGGAAGLGVSTAIGYNPPMTRPWEADIPFDDALARRLLAEQMPALAGRPMRLFGEGWDNRAYLVDDAWVVRFPRRQAGIRYMEGELAVLPHVAGRLPLPVPAPAWIGAPVPHFPAPFAAYRLLKGTTLDVADPPEAVRQQIAAPLGRFLAALHAIPPPPGTPVGEAAWVDTAARRARIDGNLAELPADLAARIRAVADRGQALLAPDSSAVAAAQRTLIHADLYARHLLLEADALVGVIDWGDVHQGDPAVDLGAAFLLLPPAAHAAFRAAYGPIDPATWARARFRAIWDVAITLHFCLATAEPLMLRAGTRALEWLEAEG